MSNAKIVIGTRGSRLALLQCYQAVADLQDISKTKYNELIDSEFKIIVTTGDAMQGTPGAANLTKKAWIDKIEEALLDKSIDIAIHSGKDIPKDIADGTKLIPLGRRNSPFDVFVGRRKKNGRVKFSDLQEKSCIGTASLRRGLFLKEKYAAYEIIPHRGNVTTRIEKLDNSESLDGIILAAAGLNRLNIDCEYEELSHDVIVPSALQGTLVAQIRFEDQMTESIIKRVIHPETKTCFEVERELSEFLGADCKSCVGVYAYVENNTFKLIVSAINPSSMEKIEFIKEVDLPEFEAKKFLEDTKSNSNFLKIAEIVI